MPTLAEFIAQRQGGGSSLGQFIAQRQQERPGALARFGTNLQDRAADIGNFLLPGQPFDEASVAAESLPEAEGFGEKVADFLGAAAPDVAIAAAAAPFVPAAAGAVGLGRVAGSLLGREALLSAALAPIEFGTREPAEAATITATAPIAGTAIGKGLQLAGRGISHILGRGAGEVAPELAKDTDLKSLVELAKRRREFTPQPARFQEAPSPRSPEQFDPFEPQELVDALEMERFARAAPAAAREAPSVEDAGGRLFFHGTKEPTAILREGLRAKKSPQFKGDIRGHLDTPASFLSTDEGVARAFAGGEGTTLPMQALPGTRILTEGTPAFHEIASTVRVPRGPDQVVRRAAAIVDEANRRGFDAVEFADQAQIGTVVTNPRNFAPAGEFTPRIPPPLHIPTDEALATVAGDLPTPSPELLRSVRAKGIETPLEIGVNPETGTRTLFEGKHRLAAARALGLENVPTREVPIGPELEAMLQKELVNNPGQAIQKVVKRSKTEQAQEAGRAVRLSDVIEVGDDAAQREAWESLSEGSQAIKEILEDEADALAAFNSMKRMPPEAVRDVVDAVDGLAGEKASRFAKRLKGKGACPI